MPNIDVNTYFFTAVVPVCNDGIVERDGMKSSPIHVVREVLETLPTALQSYATEDIGINSPFARNLRTHFARIVVLDQPNFNGRNQSDPIVDALPVVGQDVSIPQPVDQLACPYILVMIDFDLPDASGSGEPRRYLEELWSEMAPELKSIFQYCYGFDTIADAKAFAGYMIGCQVETTMPFHDYWWTPPKLNSVSLVALALIPGAGALVAIAALLAMLVERVLGWFGVHQPMALLDWASWTWVAIGIAVLIVGVLIDYWVIMRKGAKPFPAAPATSLRHVLKGLYLQQAFTRFAREQQHRDPAEWGAAFRAFLESQRPADLDGPTQPAGVIRSKL